MSTHSIDYRSLINLTTAQMVSHGVDGLNLHLIIYIIYLVAFAFNLNKKLYKEIPAIVNFVPLTKHFQNSYMEQWHPKN